MAKRKIYVFKRNKNKLENINVMSEELCEYFLNQNECDCFEDIDDFLWHLNNDCLPDINTLYFKTFI